MSDLEHITIAAGSMDPFAAIFARATRPGHVPPSIQNINRAYLPTTTSTFSPTSSSPNPLYQRYSVSLFIYQFSSVIAHVSNV